MKTKELIEKLRSEIIGAGKEVERLLSQPMTQQNSENHARAIGYHGGLIRALDLVKITKESPC